MSRLAREDLLKLSVAERLELVQDLWDSIADVPDSLELSDEEKAELDKRLDEYHADPTAGSPWEVVRHRIRNRE